jgi:membrane-associated phospholipid phosphatase
MFNQFVAWLAIIVGQWAYPGIVIRMARGCAACGIPLLVVAALTGWGRMYSCIHFPYDMASSLVIGLASAWLMHGLAGHLNPLNAKLILVSDQLTDRIVRKKSHGARKGERLCIT